MEKPNYYAIITAEVRYDNELTANAKLLYAEITALSNLNGACWATDNYFAKLYGVTTRSVQKWLGQLEEKGYIKRVVTYVNDTEQIKKRYITVVDTLPNKCSGGYRTNVQGGTEQKFVYNTTSINTTSNNKDIVPFKEIIDYLNEKTGKNFKHGTKSTRSKINARYEEGFTLQDFKQVIDTKTAEWLNDSTMSLYLRPETLFSTKFEGYLNQSSKELPKDIYIGKVL